MLFSSCWLLVSSPSVRRNGENRFFRKTGKLIPQYIRRHITEDSIIFQYTRRRILKRSKCFQQSYFCRRSTGGVRRHWRMWIIRKLLAEIGLCVVINLSSLHSSLSSFTGSCHKHQSREQNVQRQSAARYVLLNPRTVSTLS